MAALLLGACATLAACGSDDESAPDSAVGARNDEPGESGGSPAANDGGSGSPAVSPDELLALRNDLKIRAVEVASAKQRAAELEAEKEALADDAARAATELEAERRRADDLAKKLAARGSMLEGSDEAVLRARRELEEVEARLKSTQAKYGLERSKLLERIEELEARVEELDPDAVNEKIRTLERAGFHQCGVVMRVEKSRYGTHVTLRTSVDAARIGGEGILRSPEGTILAVVDLVIGRDDALSAKVLFERKNARIEAGDYIYARLK